MQVRAKMKCGNKITNADGSTSLTFYAVYSTDPDSENKAFSDATPTASVSMTIAKGKPAADFFVADEQYYVDFTLAE